MDIIEIITTVLDSSALAALAIFAIWRLERVWKQYNAEMRELRRETAIALQNNTAALARLCSQLDSQR